MSLREWWDHPTIPVAPRTQLRAAWIVLVFTLVGWPVSLLLLDEPPAILSLSWLALSITALDVIFTADVKANQ